MSERNFQNPPEHVRLAKRVAEQLSCSRTTAEQYIEGGWVTVDGRVIEVPGARVSPAQAVVVTPHANLMELTPVTLLLHKPAGYEAGLGAGAAPEGGAQQRGPAHQSHGSRSQGAPSAVTLLRMDSHAPEDASGTRVLQRHFRQLECFTPLPTEASGLVVYTQDRRIARKLAEDIESLEQECIVTVSGAIAPNGLERLCHGLSFNGRALPPIRVSWQNEDRLRFAMKGIRAGQIPAMCEAVGLQVEAIKRIRIGRVPLSKIAEGGWRYLQGWERF